MAKNKISYLNVIKSFLIEYWWLIFVLLIGGLIIIGSWSSDPKNNQEICDKPFILIGDSCCLDDNHNGICDGGKWESNSEDKIVGDDNIEPDLLVTKTEDYTLNECYTACEQFAPLNTQLCQIYCETANNNGQKTLDLIVNYIKKGMLN